MYRLKLQVSIFGSFIAWSAAVEPKREIFIPLYSKYLKLYLFMFHIVQIELAYRFEYEFDNDSLSWRYNQRVMTKTCSRLSYVQVHQPIKKSIFTINLEASTKYIKLFVVRKVSLRDANLLPPMPSYLLSLLLTHFVNWPSFWMLGKSKLFSCNWRINLSC